MTLALTKKGGELDERASKTGRCDTKDCGAFKK